MDDSQRPSKWQDDAVQAVDTHTVDSQLEVERQRRRSGEGPRKEWVREDKRGQARRHESAEKHEDTINDVYKRDCKVCPNRASSSLSMVPASSWVGRHFKVSHPSQLQV